mmetsp:Transcript_105893/g.274046  ORF Transcript_105893/g.274046 Transcript_105893/m.274046 type:complete len:218 (-) Transcript_105893:197-850(-)
MEQGRCLVFVRHRHLQGRSVRRVHRKAAAAGQWEPRRAARHTRSRFAGGSTASYLCSLGCPFLCNLSCWTDYTAADNTEANDTEDDDIAAGGVEAYLTAEREGRAHTRIGQALADGAPGKWWKCFIQYGGVSLCRSHVIFTAWGCRGLDALFRIQGASDLLARNQLTCSDAPFFPHQVEGRATRHQRPQLDLSRISRCKAFGTKMASCIALCSSSAS